MTRIQVKSADEIVTMRNKCMSLVSRIEEMIAHFATKGLNPHAQLVYTVDELKSACTVLTWVLGDMPLTDENRSKGFITLDEFVAACDSLLEKGYATDVEALYKQCAKPDNRRT